MEHNKVKLVLIFVLIAIGISEAVAPEKRRCVITTNYEVHVFNELQAHTKYGPNSSLPLRVHCASGDDDIGYHTLPTHGDLHWGFCDNYWETTLFFCHLWWGNTVQKAFDVFNFDIKQDCNTTCNWVARHEGIYFTGAYFDHTKNLTLKHYWDATE